MGTAAGKQHLHAGAGHGPHGYRRIDVSQNGFALGWDTVRLPNPLFAGDTVWAETEVLSVRESRSDPTRGIVKVRTRGVKQDGTVVIEFERSVMVWKRAHAPAESAFPELADRAD